jgi:hypothetical protein
MKMSPILIIDVPAHVHIYICGTTNNDPNMALYSIVRISIKELIFAWVMIGW